MAECAVHGGATFVAPLCAFHEFIALLANLANTGGGSLFVMFALLLAIAVDSTTSPTIRALLGDLGRGDTAAVAQFWWNVKSRGTPLVETVDGDPRVRLVTFVYRGDASTTGALVTFQNDQLANDGYYRLAKMYHAGATSIWCRTYRLPSSSRLSYLLGAVSVGKTRAFLSDADWQKKVARLGLDPLNAKRTPGPNADESAVELPDAIPQPYVAARANVARGRITRFTLRARGSGEERQIGVYLPAKTSPSAIENLLVILDGEGVPEQFPASTILDNLISEKRVAPTAAILIHNGTNTRIRDLWYSDDFTRLIRDEILPAVRRRFALPACPAHCAVAGRSLGGSAAMFLGYRAPEVFSGVIAQSGGFMYPDRPAQLNAPQAPDAFMEAGFPERDWLIRSIAETPRRALRVFLEAGAMEDIGYEPRELPRYAAGNVLTSTRHLRDVLNARGYTLRYNEFAGTHRTLNWQGTFSDGVMFVFPRK
jgi:enterochelin esterase family protein